MTQNDFMFLFTAPAGTAMLAALTVLWLKSGMTEVEKKFLEDAQRWGVWYTGLLLLGAAYVYLAAMYFFHSLVIVLFAWLVYVSGLAVFGGAIHLFFVRTFEGICLEPSTLRGLFLLFGGSVYAFFGVSIANMAELLYFLGLSLESGAIWLVAILLLRAVNFLRNHTW